MAQLTINSSTVNRIISSSATTAFPNEISVGESNVAVQVQRSIVRLPFTGVPTGSTITAAVLQLNLTDNTLATNDRYLRAYRMIRASTADCTWNTYDGSNNWGTAGAHNTSSDAEATDIGNAYVTATQVTGYFDLTLTTSKIQELFDGTMTNNGLLLQMDTEDADLHAFSTSCRWVITYTVPSSSFFALF